MHTYVISVRKDIVSRTLIGLGDTESTSTALCRKETRELFIDRRSSVTNLMFMYVYTCT